MRAYNAAATIGLPASHPDVTNAGAYPTPECLVSLLCDLEPIQTGFPSGSITLSRHLHARALGGAGHLVPTPADRTLTRRLYSYGIVWPLKEKLPLNVGNGEPATISWPTHSQSGSRSALQIHI